MSSLKAVRMKEFFDSLRMRQASGVQTGGADETGDGTGTFRVFTPSFVLFFTLFAVAAIFLFVVVGAHLDQLLGRDARDGRDGREGGDEGGDEGGGRDMGLRILKLVGQIVFNVLFLIALFYLPPMVLKEFKTLPAKHKSALNLCLFGSWAVALAAQARLSNSFVTLVLGDKKRAVATAEPFKTINYDGDAYEHRNSPQTSREIRDLQQQLHTERSPQFAHASAAEMPPSIRGVHGAQEVFTNPSPGRRPEAETTASSYTFIGREQFAGDRAAPSRATPIDSLLHTDTRLREVAFSNPY